jgi:hypothetical protein
MTFIKAVSKDENLELFAALMRIGKIVVALEDDTYSVPDSIVRTLKRKKVPFREVNYVI